MNQAENIGSTAPDLERDMLALGRRARDAAAKLATAPTGRKQAALQAMATRIRAAQADLLAANASDIARATAADRPCIRWSSACSSCCWQ